MKNIYLGARRLALLITLLGIGMVFLTAMRAQESTGSAQLLRGEGSFNDWSKERPGNRYLIKATDLPAPNATETASNQSKIVPRPADAWPKVPEGFKIDQAATGLEGPRTIVTAPNGDLFVAESNAGRIRRRLDHALRDCFLSTGPGSPIRLYREHKFHRPISLSKWRLEGARPGSDRCRKHSGRQQIRRRTLDSQSGLFERRQEAVRRSGLQSKRRG